MTGFDDNATRSLKSFAASLSTPSDTQQYPSYDTSMNPADSFGSFGANPTVGSFSAPASPAVGADTPAETAAIEETAPVEIAAVTEDTEESVTEDNTDPVAGEQADEDNTPAASQSTLENTTVSPNFTAVNVDLNTLTSIAGGYKPDMRTARCVADTDMLLKYMVSTERKHNVTMSFPAYGVDPIVFDENALDADGNAVTPAIVEVALPAKEAAEGQDNPLYEKIEVDGVLYFSCISQCLDAGYLHNVIAEAVEGVYMHNQYIYTMVGPRPIFHSEEDVEFLETLKLNSFELSALISYMQQIDGIEVIHGTFNGRSAIMFKR